MILLERTASTVAYRLEIPFTTENFSKFMSLIKPRLPATQVQSNKIYLSKNPFGNMDMSIIQVAPRVSVTYDPIVEQAEKDFLYPDIPA